MNSAYATIRNILVVGLGGIAGQLIAILATPILTRFYAPQDYGQWALLLSTVLPIATIASLRFELAVLLPESNDDAADLLVICLLLALVLAAITGALVILATDSITYVTGVGILGQWGWCIPLLVLSSGVQQACLAWYTRRANFSCVSLLTAVLPVLTVAVQLTFPMYQGSSGHGGLILGTVIGQLVTAMMAVAPLMPLLARRASQASLDHFCFLFGTYRSYPLYMTPYTMVSELRNRLAVVLFGAQGQTLAAGYYTFSDKMLRSSVTAVSSAIRPVFFQKASSQSLYTMESALLRSLHFINRVSTPWFVLFWFEHALIYELLFGAEWRAASPYGFILSVPIFILLHTNWLDRSMDVLGRQRLAFALELGFTLLSLAVLFVGLIVYRSVFLGVILQSAAVALYNAVWLVVFFRITNFNLQGLLRLAGSFLLQAIAWGSTYAVLSRFLPSAAAQLLYAVVALFACAMVARGEWKSLNRKKSVLPAPAVSLGMTGVKSAA